MQKDGHTPATTIAVQSRFSVDTGVALDFHNLHLMCSLPTEQNVDTPSQEQEGTSNLSPEVGHEFSSSDRSTWSQAVPKVAEPQATPVPVVKIAYSAEFDGIMCFFRGIVQPEFYEVESPRYCAMMAYALSCCPANYNAWRRKRDLVKTPLSFLKSAQQWWQLNRIPTDAASLSLPTDVEEEVVTTAIEKAWTNRRGLVNTLRQWTPHMTRDFAPGGVYCPLRAARWELNLAAGFCVKNHKNFQTFAHRKDLLTFAASRMSVEGADTQGHHLFHLHTRDEDGTDEDLWEASTRRLHESYSTKRKQKEDERDVVFREAALLSIPIDSAPMGVADKDEYDGRRGEAEETSARKEAVSGAAVPVSLDFSQFDDRPLCNLMLTFDAKNYHVWSYRAWFVTFFPHLLSTMEGFEDEMFYTTTMLEKDLFNNSAWCHRFFLLRRIFDPLHNTGSSGVIETSNAPTTAGGGDAPHSGDGGAKISGSERVVGSVEETAARKYAKPASLYSSWVEARLELVLDEVFNTTFSYLIKEPNNEAPYSHALGALELFGESLQRAVLAKEDGGEGEVTAAQEGEIRERILSMFKDVPFLQARTGGVSALLEKELATLAIQPTLYLLFVGKLFEKIQPAVVDLEPAAIEAQTAPKYKDRRPSLLGTFYGRHLSSAVVDALDRILPWVMMSVEEAEEAQGGDEQREPTPVLGKMCLEMLVAQLNVLFDGDTIRRKYWRQQLNNLRDDFGLDAQYQKVPECGENKEEKAPEEEGE